ncbi:MAG TPA: histidine phosphatase family protein [Roseiflexaceae bacterium]|nr:histidine phosphatase family protein [Roseiflexaceae bacterium]
MRTSIWLVRHGQTELNKARRYQGTSDSPLTPFGMRQAEALARRLRRIPFKVAITSPSLRARLTAEAILGDREAPMLDDSRWAEANHGRWEGLTYQEVRRRFPQEAAERFADALHGRPEGGESLAEVAARVAEGWSALLQRHPGGRVLLVTHATPIQLILCELGGLAATLHWRWRVDLGSVTAIDVYVGGAIVRMVNEVPKLWAFDDRLNVRSCH